MNTDSNEKVPRQYYTCKNKKTTKGNPKAKRKIKITYTQPLLN